MREKIEFTGLIKRICGKNRAFRHLVLFIEEHPDKEWIILMCAATLHEMSLEDPGNWLEIHQKFLRFYVIDLQRLTGITTG